MLHIVVLLSESSAFLANEHFFLHASAFLAGMTDHSQFAKQNIAIHIPLVLFSHASSRTIRTCESYTKFVQRPHLIRGYFFLVNYKHAFDLHK